MIHIPFYQWKFLIPGDPIHKYFFSPVLKPITDGEISEFQSF